MLTTAVPPVLRTGYCQDSAIKSEIVATLSRIWKSPGQINLFALWLDVRIEAFLDRHLLVEEFLQFIERACSTLACGRRMNLSLGLMHHESTEAQCRRRDRRVCHSYTSLV